MILVDASIWIDHFRTADPRVLMLAATGELGLHPYTLGELMLGGLPAQGGVLDDFLQLAKPPIASPAEMQAFITWAGLANTGVGYVDAHLLLSARMGGAGLLTRDKRLHAQAERLGVAAAFD